MKAKKRARGRPATGQHPVTAIRLPPNLLAALDAWRPIFSDAQTRSEFIRDVITDWLNANIRKQQRYAAYNARETHARLMNGASTFTKEREREFTKVIKNRMLYEGACDLPWPEYFAFRNKHKDCERLTDSDLTYAAEWTSCALPKRRGKPRR